MIHILPEHIANRIAAGEVVQRPASVVKELLENAIDAGASKISLIVEDAGRTLIQVVDNGCGMSAGEARIAFERHATSKISCAEDLESIETFGFRGEALAAIAAVAEVRLKTRQSEDETGVEIYIQGGRLIEEESFFCPVGANFEIRNLFFNVPARRKFLKSDASELKHIVAEFTRIGLCRCNLELRFIHNGQELFFLPPAKLKQRIIKLLGKELNKELIDFEVNSSIIKIFGYIGNPEDAKKSAGNQFFFINGRFFKSTYFQRAILNAYELLLSPKSYPSWCIFMETNPQEVDVNIHPAKTEIKMENEQIVFQILQAAIRESLGKNVLGPTIDFDMEGAPSIPPLKRGLFAPPPKIDYDPLFNPFDEEHFHRQSHHEQGQVHPYSVDHSTSLFGDQPADYLAPPQELHTYQPQILRFKEKYLLTPVRSGLLLIHIQRALQRIRYDHYVDLIINSRQESQQTLFPQEHPLPPAAVLMLEEVRAELMQMGFDIRTAERDLVIVYGLPVGFTTENEDVATLLDNLVAQLSERTSEIRSARADSVALSLSIAECRNVSEKFTHSDSMQFVAKLFASTQPSLSPLGKPCMHIIPTEELIKVLS